MALVMFSPAVIAGTLGQAAGCCNFGTVYAGPLRPPRPPPPPPPKPPPALGLDIAVSCWKFAMVTTATAPFFAPYCSGVRKSLHASPKGLGAAPRPPPPPAPAAGCPAASAGGAAAPPGSGGVPAPAWPAAPAPPRPRPPRPPPPPASCAARSPGNPATPM